MDLRVLRYFLTLAREENLSTAAIKLGITQPTLSRQLQELEDEFKTKLFNRGCRGRSLTLTAKGVILRHRAEEILLLAEKTSCELCSCDECLSGSIYVGYSAGALGALSIVGNVAAKLKKEYALEFVIRSENPCALYDGLDKGIYDFVLVPEPTDMWDLPCHVLPHSERSVEAGFYVLASSNLASKKECNVQELKGFNILMPDDEREAQSFCDFVGGLAETNAYEIQSAGSYHDLSSAWEILRGIQNEADNYAVAAFKTTAPKDLKFVRVAGFEQSAVKLCMRRGAVLSPQAKKCVETLLNKKLTQKNL